MVTASHIAFNLAAVDVLVDTPAALDGERLIQTCNDAESKKSESIEL